MLTKAKVSTKSKTAKAVKKVASKPKTAAQKTAAGLSEQAAVQKDFGYTQAVNAAGMSEQDYQAASQQQLAQAQANQTALNLNQDTVTQKARQASADDYASRGILRSGAQLDAQNGITGTDMQARAANQQTVTDLQNTRSQGLLDLQATDRTNVNKALQTATTNYYSTLKKAK